MRTSERGHNFKAGSEDIRGSEHVQHGESIEVMGTQVHNLVVIPRHEARDSNRPKSGYRRLNWLACRIETSGSSSLMPRTTTRTPTGSAARRILGSAGSGEFVTRATVRPTCDTHHVVVETTTAVDVIRMASHPTYAVLDAIPDLVVAGRR